LSQYLALNKKDKQNALLASEAAHPLNLPAYIIEKDYWVWQTLRILYTQIAPTYAEKCKIPFIFKGGTSLSKGYGLINRMSEDIDLAFSLPVLGCEPIDSKKITTRAARQRAADAIDVNAVELINNELKEALTKHLKGLDADIEVEIESDKPLNLAIYYPKMLKADQYGGAVNPRVLLETGGRSDNNPDQVVPITHMLGEAIADLIDEPFEVLTLSPERTLLEKMFGIHTNNIKGSVADRHARHLYDIVEIDDKHPDWCRNKDLFSTVVHFSDVYYKWHQHSCDSALVGPLYLVPQNKDMDDKYKADWNSMADMFPRAELPYTFDELVKKLAVIEQKANDNFYTAIE